MLDLVLEVDLRDPTEVDTVKAYCVLTEISLKLDTKDVCCIFTCWKSLEARTHGCKPFAVLPVVVEQDAVLRAVFDRHFESLTAMCDELVQSLRQPEKKARIEQNARKNTVGA
jgi:hypothetical protein